MKKNIGCFENIKQHSWSNIGMNLRRFFPEAMLCEMRPEGCIEVKRVKNGGNK